MSDSGPHHGEGTVGGAAHAAPGPGADDGDAGVATAAATSQLRDASPPAPHPVQAGAGTGAGDVDTASAVVEVAGDAGTGHAPTGRTLAEMLPWGTARHKSNQVAPLAPQIMLDRELGNSMEQSGRTARSGWQESAASSGMPSGAVDGAAGADNRGTHRTGDDATANGGGTPALAAPVPPRRRLSELIHEKTGMSRSPDALHPKPLNAEAVLARLQRLKFDTLFDDDVRSDAGDPSDVHRKRDEVAAMLAAAEGKDGAALDPAEFGLEHCTPRVPGCA